MKVYIAGKVSGLAPEEFHKKFNECRDEVAKHVEYGDIITPTDLCDDDWDWDKCMETCIPVMMKCDLVVMMPDWVDSKGAKVEKKIAHEAGIPIWYL